MSNGQGSSKRLANYPLWGFLWGFGISVVAFVVLLLAEWLNRPFPLTAILDEALVALAIALGPGLIGMLVGVIISDRQKTAELRCSCGYLLHGLSEKRCPECGRPFPSGVEREVHRTWPYLWRGFLWGFGILAVPTVVIGVPGYFKAVADVHPGDNWSGLGPPIVLILFGIGLAIAVVTGLIGMLIGYIGYRKKRPKEHVRSPGQDQKSPVLKLVVIGVLIIGVGSAITALALKARDRAPMRSLPARARNDDSFRPARWFETETDVPLDRLRKAAEAEHLRAQGNYYSVNDARRLWPDDMREGPGRARNRWSRKTLTRAIEADPSDAGAYYQRGRAHQQLDQWDQAAADYDECRKLLEAGSFPGGDYNNLAWTYVTGPPEIRNPQKALGLAQRAVELEPGNGHFLNTLGVVHYRLGQFDDARLTLARSDELNGGVPADVAFLALAYLHLGQTELAAREVDRLRSLMPGRAPRRFVPFGGGMPPRAQGRDEESRRFARELVEACRQASESAPGSALLHATHGTALWAAGSTQDALNEYREAIEIDPNDGRAYVQRGLLRAELKQWPQAVASYSKAIEVGPDIGSIWLARGRARTELGESERAIADYARFIDLSGGAGAGLAFNGTSDYVSVPNIPFDSYEVFTIEAWIAGWKTAIIGQGLAGDPENSIWISLGPRGSTNPHETCGWESGDGANYQYAVGDDLPLEWNHLAMVFDGTQQLVFLNGKLVRKVSVPRPGPMNKTRSLLVAAHEYSELSYGSGLLGSIRISKAARYDTDFTPNLELTADDETVLLFDLNAGQDSQLRDMSGHDRHGTIHGAMWVKPTAETQRELGSVFPGSG